MTGIIPVSGDIRFSLLLMIAVTTIAFSSPDTDEKRLDLYDAQDNHLMFVTFEVDQDGNDVSRTVYMSDSTFVRKVIVGRNAQGERSTETSFNFHDDTVLSTTYSSSDDTRSLSIHDQFGMDELGGPVSYQTSGTNEYTISQRGSPLTTLRYDVTEEGVPTGISVLDNSGTLLYYGTFSGVGTKRPKNAYHHSGAAISLRGSGSIETRFTLTTPLPVRCEMITLSGRRAGVLFDKVYPKGTHDRTIRLSSMPALASANGIYLITLSIDGVIVGKCTQLILQSGRSGS